MIGTEKQFQITKFSRTLIKKKLCGMFLNRKCKYFKKRMTLIESTFFTWSGSFRVPEAEPALNFSYAI